MNYAKYTFTQIKLVTILVTLVLLALATQPALAEQPPAPNCNFSSVNNSGVVFMCDATDSNVWSVSPAPTNVIYNANHSIIIVPPGFDYVVHLEDGNGNQTSEEGLLEASGFGPTD